MSTQPFLPDTPEAAFIPDPRLRDAPLSTDAVLCLSGRMRAIVRLLESSGDDGRDGFTLPHGEVLDAQIEQLRQLVMASSSQQAAQQ